MISRPFTRRDFSLRTAALISTFMAGPTAFGYAFGSGSDDDVSRGAESIHQEVIFKATRKRVYEALTDQKQFNQVVQLSAAGMSLGNVPTEISKDEGGVFKLFGGHITGRHIELLAGERIVQAWRVANWPFGLYSIARFELTAQDAMTKVAFDHTGFPQGQGQHLAEGWRSNYWEPLTKYLAQI